MPAPVIRISLGSFDADRAAAVEAKLIEAEPNSKPVSARCVAIWATMLALTA